MKLISVTACPTGIAHTFMAAEALKRQAESSGHTMAVETHGAEGVANELTAQQIAEADAVIVAADIRVDMHRFGDLPVIEATTADAIRNTASLIDRAVHLAGDDGASAPADEGVTKSLSSDAPMATARDNAPDAVDTDGAPRRLVAITSCPTGIAHTFMAAEGLERAAAAAGHVIKVETQGSVGSKNVITPEEVEAADAVIIAADTKVDLSRFAGKRIYETSTNEALKSGDQVITKALASTTICEGDAGASGGGSSADAKDTKADGGSVFHEVYQHLMTGVSYMLPFVVAGGLMIAIAFAFNIDANDAALADSFAGRLFAIGGAALALFLPVFAGYISFSIADRPGLVPGFVGGYMATQVNTGFLGALLAGFIAGYLTKWLADNIKLPDSMAGLKPVLILPLTSTFIIGVTMFYVIGRPISWLQDWLTDQLTGLQGSNAILLGLLLGAMMAFDMGGPLNKVAYTFAVGLIADGVTAPMAAVMAAGMTPPIGLAVATRLFPNRWTTDERGSAAPTFLLGLSFITEGAIPFAARDPLRVIPALIAGSATAGAISMGAGAATSVPHGGLFDLFVPGAVQSALMWFVAIIVGSLVTTAVLFFTKRPVEFDEDTKSVDHDPTDAQIEDTAAV